MTSNEPSDLCGDADLFGDGDLPTTGDDVEALRRNRPRAPADWPAELTRLAALAEQWPPPAGGRRERRTFAGLPPFEL